jgi:hypothetical protein
MYNSSFMPVKTGIQNAKNEHSDRTIGVLDAGS